MIPVQMPLEHSKSFEQGTPLLRGLSQVPREQNWLSLQPSLPRPVPRHWLQNPLFEITPAQMPLEHCQSASQGTPLPKGSVQVPTKVQN